MTEAATGAPIVGEELAPEIRAALPNLVIAGFMKCGTSSLHRYLDLHPEISMSRQKEPDFFLVGQNWERGIDWYARQFDPAAKVRGEASVNYTNLPASAGVAERMASLLGDDLRLIFMLRDPIERSLSHFIHATASGRTVLTLEQALSDPGERFLRRSMYAMQLEPFLATIGRERMLFATQEQLAADRRAVLRRAFEFLGADPDFDSPGFDREWEVTAGKDRKFRLAYRASRMIGDKTFWGRVPPRIRGLAERLVLARTGRAERPRIPDAIRAGMAGHFAADVARLREITGLDLAEWSL